jgi:hypothetical protein
MKPLKRFNSITRSLKLLSLLLAMNSIGGCAALKLCHGEAVCEWQQVEVVQCPERPKAPPELLKPLKLKAALDEALRSQMP